MAKQLTGCTYLQSSWIEHTAAGGSCSRRDTVEKFPQALGDIGYCKKTGGLVKGLCAPHDIIISDERRTDATFAICCRFPNQCAFGCEGNDK